MSGAAAKYAERLIILCDHATGVQARLYQLVEYKRPSLFVKEPELDKFARLFVRKFPEFPETLAKEKGAEIFKKRAPEITAALGDYYATFIEVLNLSDEAWKLLTELAGAIQEFKFELNVDLLAYYFNLFTRYVQIHMLVHLIDTPQMYLASYARSFHTTSGNTEPNFGRIARYLAAFKPTPTTSPLKKIQEDAQAISLCVGNTLMTFLPHLEKYATVAGYNNGKLFNILQEDPRNLAWAHQEKAQLEAIHLGNMRQWVLWGFLICPGELGRPRALDLLSICLKETFVLHIYRDKCLHIHREFDDLMDYKSANGSFKLSKYKKVFKDAYSDDEGTRKFHTDLRTFLKTELEVHETFLHECPSVLPAKMSSVMALLSLARGEVVWFFRHQHVVPFKGGSSRHKGLVWDPQVVELIHRVMRITRLIETHRRDIQEHYIEWMTKVDAQKARSIADAFLATVNNPQVGILVNNMLDGMQQRRVGENLESIRLNWYRISATLAHSQSGVPIQSSAAFSAIMNRIVVHSRNVDCVDTQLKSHASFQQLFWYKNDVMEAMRDCLKPEGRGLYAISMVSIWAHSLHNVHRLCPDEQPQIGRESMQATNECMLLTVQAIERSVHATIADSKLLRSRTNHQAVLHRMHAINAASANVAAGGAAPSLPMPGDESRYEQRAQVANLSMHHQAISDLCAAIAQQELLVCYNHEFVPREYVHEGVSNLLRGVLLNLCVAGPAISKPSFILSSFKETVYALTHVDRVLNLNLSEIVRDVLLSELSPSAEDVAAMYAADRDPHKPMPIITRVVDFYAGMFQQDLANTQGIVYNSLRRCFVTRKGGSSVTGAIDFERFTDVTELRALCTLIGPAGVAVIDRSLIRLIARNAKVVKEALIANQSTLVNLSNRFTEQSVWMDHIGGLKGLDQLCQALTVIGCILHFRTLLRAALQHVTRQHSPFVLHAVALAHRAIHDSGVVVDPKLAAIDQAAADVGMEVGEADHPLRLALASLKTTMADVTLLALLPELFGLMYLSDRWRHAVFSIELEGHTNNNHCMALAIRQLIVQFARLHIKESPPVSDVERKIVHDVERFIRISAFTMLHLKALNMQWAREPDRQYSLPHIMLFLQHAMHACAGRVERSVLEECFPFTMQRTNAIQVYEKQTNNYSSAPVAEDSND